MHTTYRQGWCECCERQRLGVWRYPKIAMHSLLVTLTCGLWLPVWFVACAFGGGWVCKECGDWLKGVR